MDLHKFNFLFITYPQKEGLFVNKIIFHGHAYYIKLMFSALLMLCLYSANDVMSECYYTSVI